MHASGLSKWRRPPTRADAAAADAADAATGAARSSSRRRPTMLLLAGSSILRLRPPSGSLLALGSGGARRWPVNGAVADGGSMSTATTTTTTPSPSSPSLSPPPPAEAATTVDLPAAVGRILRSLEHERALGLGDARGASASFSEFMAGPTGLARLQTPWLPPPERQALARLREGYGGYGALPLPAREALLADTARLADRHAHFLREGAWPAAAAPAAAVGAASAATERGRARSPSPSPSQSSRQQQQPRPGSVLRRRAGLPQVSPPRRQTTSSSSPAPAQQQHQHQQQHPLPPPPPAPVSPPPPPALEAAGFSAPPPQEEPSFAAALDHLAPFGADEVEEEAEEEVMDEYELLGEGEEAQAATAGPPETEAPPPLPPLPFRAPPSHPAQRRLQQRRPSTASASAVAEQPAAISPLFEPLLHQHHDQGERRASPSEVPLSSSSSPSPSLAPSAAAAAAAAPSPTPSPSPSPAQVGTVDLNAAWRLYWPVPPLETWRELDAGRAADDDASAPPPPPPAGEDAARHDDGARGRPMMATESLGPIREIEATHHSVATTGDADTYNTSSPPPPQPPPSSLAALFGAMCAEGGAPGLGAFVEEAALLPMVAAEAGDESEAEAMLLRDDGGGGSSSGATSGGGGAWPSADALGATVPPPPPQKHLVWRPAAAAGLFSSASSFDASRSPATYYGGGAGAPDFDDDDHAAWRSFVESAVAWRRRDDADARALRALSRSPDGDQQRTPDWHAARGSRLTASAFCNAVGWFGRYPATRLLDAQRLWREKVGLEPPPPANAAMRRGTALEPLAQRAYARLVARARGGRVEPCSFKTWSEGPAHDWLSASPDGLVEAGEVVVAASAEAAVSAEAAAALAGLPPALALARGPGVLEIKCPNKDLPDPAAHLRRLDYYAMQVQGQLEFSGREWAHLYLWTPGSGSALALVRRDREYWRVLWQVLADFWWGHVAPARVLRRAGAPDRDVLAYMPRREHPWAAELRARSRLMLREAPTLGFGKEPAEVAAAAAAMAAAEQQQQQPEEVVNGGHLVM